MNIGTYIVINDKILKKKNEIGTWLLSVPMDKKSSISQLQT